MTPAIDTAKRAQIVFRVHEYTHEPGAASYGLEAAEKLGADPGRVFKTLVAELEDGELVVAIVPVTTSLNLKALAAAHGAKRATMAEMAQAERATGYVAGGISPLGQRKPHRTVLDESAALFETIFVSAGRRGLEIELAPGDLLQLCGGQLGAIARE
jgi:Cys-tRNA(Pro)/Cys-tRNA(Cys) deacylase